ncbi:hypothetical protein [uncultured Eubacterium sp.]|uniref:hypothetical protein n=1 Tax=Eubacterium sp. TaxID=142586 RepID=UPI0032653F2F
MANRRLKDVVKREQEELANKEYVDAIKNMSIDELTTLLKEKHIEVERKFYSQFKPDGIDMEKIMEMGDRLKDYIRAYEEMDNLSNEDKKLYEIYKIADNYLINLKNEKLTKEQHEAIRDVCDLKKWITDNLEEIFANSSKQISLFVILDEYGLNSHLKDAKLPKFETEININEIPDALNTNGKYDNSSDAREEFFKVMKTLDNDLENYINIIDKEYGTTYLKSSNIE